MINELRVGPWKLKDLEKIKKNNLKVFSCFHCGGGSTMGYKLSGFDVIGGVEIDPEMMKIYRANHSPKHSFLMGVQNFNKIEKDKLPEELFDLDILDGSPPCSSFSMAGSREEAWGENKKFREGQAHQVLDDLFFEFINIAKTLQPKVVVAENVRGLVVGKAKGYVKEINKQFKDAGYEVQLFLLNSAFMGVPQKRERTFFIAKRKDLNLKKINLHFSEETIPFKNVKTGKAERALSEREMQIWSKKLSHEKDFGQVLERIENKRSNFSIKILNDNDVACTLTTKDCFVLGSEPRKLNSLEVIRVTTFPDDYNFLGLHPRYLCGMSVPPFMMQRVSNQIAHQWFGKQELKI